MWVGIITTASSLFYALREGYYSIQQRQQQREQIRSYQQVAERFMQMDNLTYAEQSLRKALALSPGDVEMQYQLFMLQAQGILRDKEQGYDAAEYDHAIPNLLLEGYRLLQMPFSSARLAHIMTTLGRLQYFDYARSDDKGITRLFNDAYQLTPDDPGAQFYLGRWLLQAEIDATGGIELMQQSIQKAPDNPLFLTELAEIYMNKQQYAQALPLYRQAIAISDQQTELGAIRAANGAKSRLVQLLRRADESTPIDAPRFLQLSSEQLDALLQQALSFAPTNRHLQLLAARFYVAQQNYLKAKKLLQPQLEDSEFISLVERGYNQLQAQLYIQILQATKANPDLLRQLQDAIQYYHDNRDFRTLLEWGVDNGPRFKLGIRFDLRNKNKGIMVDQVFSGYSFAKAGIQPGDMLTSIAHRDIRDINDLLRLLPNFTLGDELSLQVIRDQQLQNLTLTLE